MAAVGLCAAYEWPASPRIAVQATESWETFDKIKVRTCAATLGGERILFPYLANYAIGPAEARWNLNFIIPQQPEVKVGVAAFRKGDWIPGVNEGVLLGYIGGLEKKGAANVKSTAQGTLSSNMLVMGTLPQLVEYTLEGTRFREYWAERDEKIFVFAIIAPAKLFDGIEKNARLIIARASSAQR